MQDYMDTQKKKQKRFWTAPDPEHDFFFPKQKILPLFTCCFSFFRRKSFP